MKLLSSWRVLLAVTLCFLPVGSRAWADDTKSTEQNAIASSQLAPFDGLEPRYKTTRQVSAAPRGLMAWWTGDGDALDSLGQNNGRARGDVTYVPGLVGRAFHFDGQNSYVKVSTTDLDPGPGAGLTLDMWVKPDGLSKLQPVAGWAGNNVSGVSLWIEAATQDGKAKFGADLRDTKGAAHRLLSAQAVIEANKWQHLLLEYSRETGLVRLFCNGQVQAEKNLGRFDLQTHLDFYIGKHFYINGGNTTFQGAIDEVSITTHSLDESEVQDVFRAGSAGRQLLSEKDTTLGEEQRRASIDGRLASFRARNKENAISVAIYVDGSDFLHIQGDKMWLVHDSWQLPGGNGLQPTRINGKEWLPTWNDKVSDKATIPAALPQDGEPQLAIDILNNGDIPARSDAPFNVRVTQEPSADNNYEAVLYLDDSNVGGAHWFVFNVSWTQKQ